MTFCIPETRHYCYKWKYQVFLLY